MDQHIDKKGRISKYDRISRLPDPLLRRILSFLSTRDSVRTSVLSSRWRNLWQSVPVFDYDNWFCNDKYRERYAFTTFVNKFLDSHNGCLEKFRLRHRHESFEDDPSVLTSWFNALVKHNVQDLELSLGPRRPTLPQTLYTSVVLTRLRLDSVALETPKVVSLPCLKILHLGMVRYANDLALDTLISSCSALEDLVIERFGDGRKSVVTVRSQTLKRFGFGYTPVWYNGDKEDGLLVDAPRLEYLKLCDFNSEKLAIKELGPSASVDICVTFNLDYTSLPEGPDPNDDRKRTTILNFFMEVSRVQYMKIHSETLEAVYHYFKSEPRIQFKNLASLHIIVSKSSCELLANLLESSPNLKSLVLEWWYLSKIDDATFSSVPQSCLPYLEFVQMKMAITEAMKLKSLVKYFLENSKALKTLMISYAKPATPHDEYAILKELLMFRRCSSECQVFVTSVMNP